MERGRCDIMRLHPKRFSGCLVLRRDAFYIELELGYDIYRTGTV